VQINADGLTFTSRTRIMGVVAAAVLVVLVVRAAQLQLLRHQELLAQAEGRHERFEPGRSHRTLILARDGEVLARSVPVIAVWADPQKANAKEVGQLASAMGLATGMLERRLQQAEGRRFVYLARGLPLEAAQQVAALHLPGIHTTEEERRLYPLGPEVGHLLGFTDSFNVGLEGMERSFNEDLNQPSKHLTYLADGHGRPVGLATGSQADQGLANPQLVTTINWRLQHVAFEALAQAVSRAGAKGGSLVAVEPGTGEIWAMVNQPAFDPNQRDHLYPEAYRNRAITDAYELGSVLKPLVVAAALDAGVVTPNSMFDTGTGAMRVGNWWVRDIHPQGRINLTRVLAISSNVGAAMVALRLDSRDFLRHLAGVGFGRRIGLGLPGEVAGGLPTRIPLSRIQQAVMSFGYGLTVTPVQLAQAYAALANDGRLQGLTLLRDRHGTAQPAFQASTAREVRLMLEQVITNGTGRKAAIPGYRVAGKTGTAIKTKGGVYHQGSYLGSFVGMAPAERPALVVAVVIDEPRNRHYGGDVAAPAFARVMSEGLAIMGVSPDD
jgi:cell division protein FtsI (penicillin-binding protein 3)